MNDREIIASLDKRTTDELLAFQKKARRYNTPHALAVRFFTIKILADRVLGLREEPTR